VPKSNLLGSVCGVTNAVEVTSRALGKSLFIGAGAGALPTANSVLSDVLDIANGRSVKRLPSHGRERVADSQSCATYYLRAQADDKTGVLARLTDLLAGQGIGIDALLQPEIDAALGSPSAASIVLITHATEESRMRQAVSRIQAIPEIRGPVSLIRVFEGE